MAKKSEEIKTGTLPVDIALLIIDHLEIPNMENWTEAVGMREQLKGKILEAKRMHKRLEGLEFLNSRMIETLAETDFKLTFRTMHRLIKQAESHSEAYAENLDESKDTSRQKVYFEFKVLEEDESFLEVHYTSNAGDSQNFCRGRLVCSP